MKRQCKKLLLIPIFSILALVLSGCGAKVATTLNINNEFVGERVITCTAAKTDVQSKFKGGVQKVDQIFASKCPAEMKYEKTEDASNYIYTIHLAFKSLDDYNEKVKKVTGKNVKATFLKPNSVFANGIAISENFSSVDLLNWFKKDVEEEKLIDGSSNFWEVSNSQVNLDGKNYSVGENIQVNEITYYPLDGIFINTSENADGSFDRVIRFTISNFTYDKKADEIKKFMDSLVPQGEKGTWTSNNYSKTFTITFKAKDDSELSEKTAKALSSKNATFEKSDGSGKDAFSKYTDLEENIDLSAFGSDSQSRVGVEYKFVTGAGNKFVKVQTGMDKSPTSLSSNTYSNRFYTNVLNIKLSNQKKFMVNSVDVKTSVDSAEKIDKSIIFTYEKSVTAEDAEGIKKYFEASNIEGLKATVSANDNGQQSVEINLAGNLEKVNKALAALFGDKNSINYTTAKDGLSKMESRFSESINMTQFLKDVGYDKNINYSVKARDGEKIKSLSVSGKQYISEKSNQEQGDSFSTAVNSTAQINYVGSKTVIAGVILTVIIWLIALLAIVTGLIFLAKWLAKKDGLEYENTRVLLRKYGKITWSKTTVLFGDLKTFCSGIRDMYIPDPNRIPVIKYFYGSKWPIFLVIITILQIPSIVGHALKDVSYKIFKSFGLYIFLDSMLPVVVLIIALIWFLVEKFRTNPEQEKLIDALIQEDFKGFKERALKKLCLVEEQVDIISPIEVIGPYYDYTEPAIYPSLFSKIKRLLVSLLAYVPSLVFKYGSDKKVRYSLVQAQIFLFSDTQIYVYTIDYDLCTGEIFEESTTEYFYKDVDCVIAGEKAEKIISNRKIVNNNFEFFKVIVSSGEYNHAVIDVEKSVINNQIIAMRNLIREKKEKTRKR